MIMYVHKKGRHKCRYNFVGTHSFVLWTWHHTSSRLTIHNFFLWRNSPIRAQALSMLMFLNHTQLDTQTHPVGFLWTGDQPVAEAATNTTDKHKRGTSMPSVEFEATIPAIKRPKTWALDRTATTHIAIDKLSRGDTILTSRELTSCQGCGTHEYRHVTLSHVRWITRTVLSQEIVMECCSSTSSSDCEEDLENVCAILAADTGTVRRKERVHDINMKR
jgi:hypothetical protein